MIVDSGKRTSNALRDLSTTLPKYTSGVVSKYLKTLAGPYLELMAAFPKDVLTFKMVCQMHAEVFIADENEGLVAQVRDIDEAHPLA